MAPEQLDGRARGPAVDVYALAAISFEALSGKRPREGRTPMEIAHKIANEGAPDLRDVWPSAPKEAARVLQRGMAREPEDRPESCRRVRSRALRGARGDACSEDAQDPAALGADRRSARPRLRREAPHPHSLRQPRPTPHLKPMLAQTPNGGEPATPAQGRQCASRIPAELRSATRWKGGNGGSGIAASRSTSPGRKRPRVTAFVLAAIFIALAAATIAGAVSRAAMTRAPSRRAPTTRREAEGGREQEAEEEGRARGQEGAEGGARRSGASARSRACPGGARRPRTTPPAAPSSTTGLRPHEAQGDYAGAVPILQEAVNLFPPDSTDINYAYALFNLGKSLRLAGRPARRSRSSRSD